jgi:hypothetical protein
MGEFRTDPSTQDLHRGLLLGAAVMLAVAGVAGLVGLGMISAAMVAATRNWYHRVDMSPQQIANLKWNQAKAAMGAGAGAWRDVERSEYAPRSSAAVG